MLLPFGTLAAEQNDLREFRVGMPVPELPETGYRDFACAADPARALSDWREFRQCPAEPDGSRAVTFRYDDGSPTQVGGQSVTLSLLIGNNAAVSGIRIETDPNARLYQHKRAYLFAQQARARFGDEGWACTSSPPTPAQQPVGGVFFHEHCEKATPSRHFVVDRQVYRDPAKDLRDFTDATQLTIRGAE